MFPSTERANKKKERSENNVKHTHVCYCGFDPFSKFEMYMCIPNPNWL